MLGWSSWPFHSSQAARHAWSPYADVVMDALGVVADWPVDDAAVGVVHFGAGPLAQSVTVGDTGRVQAWASVTKPATALSLIHI